MTALLVGVDGVDGAGKTTLVADLCAHYAGRLAVKATRNAGDDDRSSSVGRTLYELALNTEFEADDVERQLLLMAAVRRHHRLEIAQLRSRNELVLCDRSSLSVLCYASVTAPWLRATAEGVIRDVVVEDLILWIDVPVEVALARVARDDFPTRPTAQDAIESKPLAFHQQVSIAFSEMSSDPRVVRLDGDVAKEQLARAARDVIDERLALSHRP